MKTGKPHPHDKTVEQLFPDPRGRRAGDAAIDEVSVREPMTTFLDAWEGAYHGVVGDSPFRPRAK